MEIGVFYEPSIYEKELFPVCFPCMFRFPYKSTNPDYRGFGFQGYKDWVYPFSKNSDNTLIKRVFMQGKQTGRVNITVEYSARQKALN